MLKRSLIHCGLAAMLLVTSSCLFDPDEEPIKKDPPATVELMDLTEKWHVLNNIEYAYDNRIIDVYNALLDLDFTFFLAAGDVGGPGGLPEQWGREDELRQVGYLFIANSQPVPVGPVCRSIRMDLTINNLQWVEIIPAGFPDEIWYTTTVYYNFTFQMEPTDTYNSETGARAEFTVRNVGTDAAPHWQLIEWRDLEGN
jgi:hypothetical protein